MSYVTNAQLKELVDYLSYTADKGYYVIQNKHKSDYVCYGYRDGEKGVNEPSIQIGKFKEAQDMLTEKLLKSEKYSSMLAYWEKETGIFKPNKTNWCDLNRYAKESDLKELKDNFNDLFSLLRSAQLDWEFETMN